MIPSPPTAALPILIDGLTLQPLSRSTGPQFGTSLADQPSRSQAEHPGGLPSLPTDRAVPRLLVVDDDLSTIEFLG